MNDEIKEVVGMIKEAENCVAYAKENISDAQFILANAKHTLNAMTMMYEAVVGKQ